VLASDTLPVQRLSTARKQTLITQLRTDVAATQLTKTDSYYGGKELYRAANLYQLALQLGQKDLAATLHDELADDLGQWLDPLGYQKHSNRYFYYDTTVKGLVAVTPSYGSETFNDHHFHYGYFLYAAAVVSAHDAGFERRNKAMLNLIASDIGAPTDSSSFPKERVFDPYFGHSWASGNGDFADGNNQESSSEAINAWNGLALWGAVSGQSSLQQSGTWMLSRETAAAAAEWTAIPTNTAPYTSGYNHASVGMNWGGKRDYATFFSGEPSAAVGIQLIPLNPSMDSLRVSSSAISANLAAAVPDGNYNVQFGDYLLMYQALTDKTAALKTAGSLDTQNIDDANSRSYVLAWIMTR
jgi:endoglucanase Acf2